MIEAVRQWTGRVLGRGDAAISVPVLDGALKSNRLIEDAEVVADRADAERVREPGGALARAAVGEVELHDAAAAAELHDVVLPAIGRIRLRSVGGPEHIAADGRRERVDGMQAQPARRLEATTVVRTADDAHLTTAERHREAAARQEIGRASCRERV